MHRFHHASIMRYVYNTSNLLDQIFYKQSSTDIYQHMPYEKSYSDTTKQNYICEARKVPPQSLYSGPTYESGRTKRTQRSPIAQHKQKRHQVDIRSNFSKKKIVITYKLSKVTKRPRRAARCSVQGKGCYYRPLETKGEQTGRPVTGGEQRQHSLPPCILMNKLIRQITLNTHYSFFFIIISTSTYYCGHTIHLSELHPRRSTQVQYLHAYTRLSAQAAMHNDVGLNDVQQVWVGMAQLQTIRKKDYKE